MSVIPHPLTRFSTITEAKDWLRERLDKGADCPVCTQRAQLYRRKLNAGMARALIQVYKHAGTEWTKVQDIPDGPRGGDYAKLRFWGLLESADERVDDGNSSGAWRVTPLGEDFVRGLIRVPSHVGTFNNKNYPIKDNSTITFLTVRDALGKKFNYNELMRG